MLNGGVAKPAAGQQWAAQRPASNRAGEEVATAAAPTAARAVAPMARLANTAVRRPTRKDMVPPALWALITEPTDNHDISEPADTAEAMLNAEATEPTEPIDSAEPTEPTDSTEPWLPMESTEPSEPRDHSERGMAPQ